jgi:anti-sigma factor (TIGR02949 family)
MNCTETKRYLEPFLDGELDAEGNLKVLEHLNLCGDCNRVFDAEKTLRGALRDRLTNVKAPGGLVDRCCTALSACDAERRRRWIMPAVSAVAAAAIAAIVTSVLMSTRPTRPNEPEVAALAVAFHEANRTGTSGDAT